MSQTPPTEMLLIRHAPGLDNGRMAGRRDVAADCGDVFGIAALAARLGMVEQVITSPALRCVQTARAVWPDAAQHPDPRLWEQDFGCQEGLPYAELPDLGPMTRRQMAEYRPDGGESFDDLCARVLPVFSSLRGPVVIVAHAGIIRAALGWALGDFAAGLAFQIAPLSLTQINHFGGTDFAISAVNWTAR